MKECGVGESWTKLFSFEARYRPSVWIVARLKKNGRDGVMILQHNQTLICIGELGWKRVEEEAKE